MKFSDDRAPYKCTGRYDNGNDESIFYSKLAEASALGSIDKLTAIEQVRLQVALHSRDRADHFRFSRSRTDLHTVLHLAVGKGWDWDCGKRVKESLMAL